LLFVAVVAVVAYVAYVADVFVELRRERWFSGMCQGMRGWRKWGHTRKAGGKLHRRELKVFLQGRGKPCPYMLA